MNYHQTPGRAALASDDVVVQSLLVLLPLVESPVVARSACFNHSTFLSH